MATLMSMQPSIPEDDDDDDDGNDSESYLIKSPYSSEDQLLAQDYSVFVQKTSYWGRKCNVNKKKEEIRVQKEEKLVSSLDMKLEEHKTKTHLETKLALTNPCPKNQGATNHGASGKESEVKTRKETTEKPLITVATPKTSNEGQQRRSWVDCSPQRCKSSEVLLPFDGKMDKIIRIREATQKRRPQLPDEKENLENERNEAKTKDVSKTSVGISIKAKEESENKASTTSNGKEEKKVKDFTSGGKKLGREGKEGPEITSAKTLYQRQITEWNRKHNNRNNTISSIRQTTKSDKCTCNSRIQKNGNLYLVDASDLLFSSRQLANMERRKTWGSETWTGREGYQRRKLFGRDKEWDLNNRDLRNLRAANTNRNIVLADKRLQDKSRPHMKYSENARNQFSNSKLQPKSFSLENRHRNQCFFIGLDQSCAYGNFYANTYHGGVCRTTQDNNNNCPKWHHSSSSTGYPQRKKHKRTMSKTTRSFYKLQYMLIGEKLFETRYSKTNDNSSSIKRAVSDFFGKMRSYYKIWKYTGYKKMKMTNFSNPLHVMKNSENSRSKIWHSVRECKSSDILNGTASSQQDGDNSNSTNGENHWWQASRSNSENSRTNDEGRVNGLDQGASKKSNANVSPVVKSASELHRSFDVDYRGRKKKTVGRPVFQRSISSDEDKKSGAFVRTIKYRDKKLVKRPSADDLSSSSEDPADSLRGVLNARMSKSCERKKTSPTNRKDGLLKSFSRDISRSRKRYTKVKSDQSSSSHSSSSSRSGSRTRAGTKPAPRAKRKSASKELSQSEKPSKPEENSDDKYDPSQFLQKLDTVLSDLVENEKKKISKFGQPKLKEIKHESFDEIMAKKRPHRKIERPPLKKKSATEMNDDINPSIQQLRATLRAVRVKKRSPTSGDLLDKHAERFTERLPHNPRILKSQQPSQLLTQRCYQPPKRKPSQPRDIQNDATMEYPSDFYSSDEEHEELQRVCKDDQTSSEKTPKITKEREERTDTTTDEKDENDTCYGSDQMTSRDSATTSNKRMQEIVNSSVHGDAGDSGEFSVDSAYTGSRGATPESVLNPSVKPRRSGGSLTTPPLPSARFYSAYRRMPHTERLVELKRSILNDIRESKLYSDESINSLLADYKRKCCDVNAKDVQEVILSIQEDLGVKPRPDYYVCHMLKVAEEIRQKKMKGNVLTESKQQSNQNDSNGASTLTEDYDVIKNSNRNIPTKEKCTEHKIQAEGFTQKVFTSSTSPINKNTVDSATPKKTSNIQPKPKNQDVEDKAWAESIMGDVDPNLLAQAKEEAESKGDDSEHDWSGYVADLCNQFDIKI